LNLLNPLNTKLPKVNFNINSKEYSAIIDTGSTLSIINPAVLIELKLIPIIVNGPALQLANQTIVELNAYVNIEIHYENGCHIQKFFVYDLK